MKNVTLFTKAAASLRQINIFKRLMMAFVVVIFLPMAIFGGFSVKNLAAQNNDGAVSSARARLRNVDSALSERLRSINDISYKLYQDRNLHHLLCEDYRGDMKWLRDPIDLKRANEICDKCRWYIVNDI
ncbi:hypothetical protein [Acutalibacter intestini]|uniref:hypothetical protein n=1 Tax=Acutalibacter intestini TaxID=3093659 RepID=UPI002AC94C4C|nr:hypothetical protein [Acutalibacter sp. M00204]